MLDLYSKTNIRQGLKGEIFLADLFLVGGGGVVKYVDGIEFYSDYLVGWL